MNKDIQFIKMAQRDLCMEDEDYRAMLSRVTGVPSIRSAKQLNTKQVAAVKDELRRLGFQPTKQQQQKKKLVRTVRFLWMQLGEAGLLKNTSQSAMWVFVGKRTTSGNGLKANVQELQTSVQMLKSWCEREGVSTGSL